jgi:hypothetical protein
MTRDELNLIISQMVEARWKPRLLDASTGEYWDYDSKMMACESGLEQKQLPKDIDIRESMFIEFEMRDDSMIDAGIMQYDSMKARLNAPVTDGKVVLTYYEGRTYIGVYCKDKDVPFRKVVAFSVVYSPMVLSAVSTSVPSQRWRLEQSSPFTASTTRHLMLN